MNRYAVGVGSNQGDRRATIVAAAAMLGPEITLLASSTLHETAPVGGPSGQGAFLNAVWIIATNFGPHQVLHRLQTIESALGRTRSVHWGSRTLDLDLLLRDDGIVIHSTVLSLPHPRWHQRTFVTLPLSEVAGFLK